MPITTAVCPEIHNEEVARQVKAEQTNLLYRFGWAADWPSTAAAGMLFWISWGEADGLLRASCAIALGAAALTRFGLGMAFPFAQ